MDIPKGGLIGKTVGLARYISHLRISVYAANASFFMILAMFPTLLLLLGLLRYTGMEVESLTGLLEGFLPQALVPNARRLIGNAYRNSTGALLSLSAVTALWSAGRGLHGLLRGLNRVYEAEETRGYFATRWLSIRYTVGFLVVLVLTLVLQVFSHVFNLITAEGFLGWMLTEVVDLRFFVLLGVQTFLFAALYVVLPNRENTFRKSLPGALGASLGWMTFSKLYSVYVRYFSSYSNIYGSVYAVALSMLWLYCCVNILFYGGLLNKFLENVKK